MMMESGDGQREPVLTQEDMDVFLERMRTEGMAPSTVNNYRTSLRSFLKFLPEGKQIARDSLLKWRNAMKSEGVTDRVIWVRISGVNKYLEFYELEDFRLLPQRQHIRRIYEQEMTREEYLRLLRTAWKSGKVRDYLIIKILCTTGISISDLTRISGETVKSGELAVVKSAGRSVVRFPPSLRHEMRDYAEKMGITDGPLLRNRAGSPLSHQNVCQIVQYLADQSGVSKEVATPRHLRRLYRKTRDGILTAVSAQAEQLYENLLENEMSLIRPEAGEKDFVNARNPLSDGDFHDMPVFR